MNTILVPTDFSSSSKNASHFAINLAIAIGAPRIVFYHFYETVLIYKPTGELDEEATVGPHRAKSMENLEIFIDSLGVIPPQIEIEAYQGAASVNDGVAEVAKITHPDLIVMGIAGGGIFKETFLGSHSLSVAKKVTVPVLIVPSTAVFKHFEKITFLSDFTDVEKYTPINEVKKFLNNGPTKLSFLHLLKSYETTADNHPAKIKLESLFKEYNPVFHVIESEHYTDDIIDFTAAQDIDILIVVPKYHSLIETIFNDHTKKLAFHSKVPLLIVHK